MAYMRSLDEQRQQQQAGQQEQGPQAQPGMARPNFVGGQNITADGGMTAAPSNSSPTQGKPGDNGTSSGNWVNIDSYLNANPSFGATADKKGQSLLGSARSDYGNASDPMRSATGNFKLQTVDPGQIHAALSMGSLGQVKDALNQSDYLGPSTFDFNANANKNVVDTKKLSNLDTATDVLAEDAIKQGNYGYGLKSLDTSLLGADKNYKEAAPKMWDNVNGFINYANQDKSSLEGLADWDKQAVANQKNLIRGTLGKEKENYQKSINDRIAIDKDQAKRTRQGYADSYADWYNGQYKNKLDANLQAMKDNKDPRSYRFKQEDLFKYGPLNNFRDPTGQNEGTDEEYRALGGIGELLGESPVYSRGGEAPYFDPKFDVDNGQSMIDSWKNNPNNPFISPMSGGNNHLGPQWNDEFANAILQNSSNLETPEQLYKRLGLS